MKSRYRNILQREEYYFQPNGAITSPLMLHLIKLLSLISIGVTMSLTNEMHMSSYHTSNQILHRTLQYIYIEKTIPSYE